MRQLTSPSSLRFGVFEFNFETGELRKQGLRVKLGRNASKVLSLLLEQPGQVQTREEIQRQLWGHETFVNFEQSINKAIHEVREALGDAATNPRYIETLAGRGYRFILLGEELTRSPRKLTRKAGAVAVLPFTTEPANQEMELLNRRIVESVIDAISRRAGVRVLAYNTVQHYREKDLNPEMVAKDLLVRVVAMGEMIKPNDDLLAHVELIDAANGIQLCGGHFRESFKAVLTRPERLARRIFDQLRPFLARTVSRRRERRDKRPKSAA